MGATFDDVLTQLGTGKWNLMYILGISYAFFMLIPHIFPGPFVSPPLNHTCKEAKPLSPSLFLNDSSFILSSSHYLNLSSLDNSSSANQCEVKTMTLEGDVTTVKCTAWDYDNTTFTSTITSEYNMVCDDAIQRVIYQSVCVVGRMVGDVVSGFISDSIGRRRPTIVCLILYCIVTIASCWITSLVAIMVFRFFIGLLLPLAVYGFYTTAMEVCEPKYRSLVGILVGLPWAFAVMAWGAAAYFIRDWRQLMLITSLPCLTLLPILLFLDESPRWLLVKGRYAEALVILKKAARWNRVELPPDEIMLMKLQSIDCQEKKTENENCLTNISKSVTILFKTPKVRMITLVAYLSFISVGACYMGLTLAGVFLDVNPFLYMVISGIMEIPAYTVTVPIIARFGRKNPVLLGYFFCSIALLAVPFIPQDVSWLIITLALVGKLCITSVAQILFLYFTELFPTECRMRGIGTAMLISSASNLFVPYLTDSLGITYPWLPSVVFGGLVLLAGLVTLPLPETLNKPLNETVASLEYGAINKVDGTQNELEDLNPTAFEQDNTSKSQHELP
ncbi:organic cation transporter protein-like [Oratosquilla oratoria]|uniref:organic cation transporter protein-like n=1 Tax=Oratosquilla oratoria TaxID=337810 RepID=UPI003F7615B1